MNRDVHVSVYIVFLDWWKNTTVLIVVLLKQTSRESSDTRPRNVDDSHRSGRVRMTRIQNGDRIVRLLYFRPICADRTLTSSRVHNTRESGRWESSSEGKWTQLLPTGPKV